MKKTKIISCIGDSLTEGDYGIKGKRGIANVHKENYPYFLNLISSCEVRNFGYSGFRSTHVLEKFNNGEIDVTNSDVVIILLGTNGGQSEEGNSEQDQAYISIINKVKEASPKATIYLCTPPNVTENPNYSNCGYKNNVVPARIFVRNLAKTLNLHLIDLALSKKLTAKNEDKYQSADGLHFNEKGYKEMAKEIYHAIKKSL